MHVVVSILEPRGNCLGELKAEFANEVPADWDVQPVASAKSLLARLAENSSHQMVILPDHWASGTKNEQAAGLTLIPKIREISPYIPIVVVADQGDVERAARAIEAGATDFLVLGERLRQRIATMLGKLRTLLEAIDRNKRLDQRNAELREALQSRLKIVGRSPEIERLVARIERVAKVPRPVLIVGERGTGKELVARAIHWASAAAKGPIVTVNCAAVNDSLLESELFGHERGAFTGADTVRHGKFEQSDGGTLFLDEIGNMSLGFQEKILRVVEYGIFTRVGGAGEHKTSARIIAATNRDLREQIRDGEFLADLYDRLTFETIEVPPLRDRAGDIDVLSHYFLEQFAKETPVFAGKRLSPDAVAALKSYNFPGNVRELKNIIERAAYRDTQGEISREDLGLTPRDTFAAPGGSFSEKVHAYGRHLIADALVRAEDNQARAARDMGMTYHRFRYFMKKYLGPAEEE